jgi:hypothetical protein
MEPFSRYTPPPETGFTPIGADSDKSDTSSPSPQTDASTSTSASSTPARATPSTPISGSKSDSPWAVAWRMEQLRLSTKSATVLKPIPAPISPLSGQTKPPKPPLPKQGFSSGPTSPSYSGAPTLRQRFPAPLRPTVSSPASVSSTPDLSLDKLTRDIVLSQFTPIDRPTASGSPVHDRPSPLALPTTPTSGSSLSASSFALTSPNSFVLKPFSFSGRVTPRPVSGVTFMSISPSAPLSISPSAPVTDASSDDTPTPPSLAQSHTFGGSPLQRYRVHEGSGSFSVKRPSCPTPGIESNWRDRSSPSPSPKSRSSDLDQDERFPSFERFPTSSRSPSPGIRVEGGAVSPSFAKRGSASSGYSSPSIEQDWRAKVSPTPSSRSLSSPSFDTARERRVRLQKEFQEYRALFPWIEKGEIIEKPLPYKNMELDERFFKTYLGQKALVAAEIYLEDELVPGTAKELLLGKKYTQGTCFGQSFALMIALMKLENGAAGTLLDHVETDFIRFFMTLEALRGNERCPETLPSGVSVIDIRCNERIVDLALQEFHKLSGLARVAKQRIAYLEKDAKAQMRQIFENPRITAFEIGLYHDYAGAAHSIVALFGKNSYMYDLQTGLIKETTREDFIHDLFNYFETKYRRANPLCTIYIESFAPAKKEEAKGSSSTT